jgi:hypothetical protein
MIPDDEKSTTKRVEQPVRFLARVSLADKSFLKDAARAANLSEIEVLRRIIRFVKDQPFEEQHRIIAEKGLTAVSQAGSLMVRQAWLQHAFGGNQWHWALEEAMALAEDALRVGAPDAWRFAQYRAAYCWLEIAMGLRADALLRLERKGWDVCFTSADQALCAAIAHNIHYSKGVPQTGSNKPPIPVEHPLVTYNIACAWSLRAQYIVERSLGPSSLENKKLSRILKRELSKQNKTTTALPSVASWSKRAAPQDREKVRLVANTRGQAALNALESITKSCRAQPPRDIEFIVRRAENDIDLEFLRREERLRARLEGWIARRGDASLLSAFATSLASSPAIILETIASLDPDR